MTVGLLGGLAAAKLTSDALAVLGYLLHETKEYSLIPIDVLLLFLNESLLLIKALDLFDELGFLFH